MSLPMLSGGVAWYAAAFSAWLAAMILGLFARKHSGPAFPILVALGSLCLVLAAIVSGNGALAIPLPCYLGDAALAFTVDPLSRWFLAIIGIVGAAVALFSPGYLLHLRPRVSLGFVWAALALLLASMAAVVLAGNALVFLVAWELMALSSFALVASDHAQRSIRRAALVYLGATRIGTAFLMAGFLWLHALTGSWSFSAWGVSGPAALGPALLLLVGLGTKAGCWPFHLWLPIAHPAAPAPVSALMSGVMIKTAIYAMLRFFVLGDALSHPALGTILLLLGAVSALWGVLFALLQHDLKRLLAYHSVENIGIILMGIGIALLGKQFGVPALGHLGLLAALFHTLNHAVFKSLLFFGAGAIDARAHLRDVERLGGLLMRMPWTGALFVTGSAAICALPPLNGFASEWLLYQGFFTLALQGPHVGIRLGAMLLMGWLALIGGLAIACFVKAVGVVFLGLPRSRQAAHATEGSRGMIAGQALLAALCVALGIGVPLALLPLGAIVDGFAGARFSAACWTLPLPLLALLAAGLLLALTAALALLARRAPARSFITWECGFGPLGPRMQYTATSFAQPVSRLFSAIYRYGVEIRVGGRHRRHFPEEVAGEATHEPYLETRVYAPLLRGFQRAASVFLLRLQAGSIHQYLWYMALVLALLIWVGVR